MIAVIGCGRIGLPLCLFLADRGLRVVGVDSDPERLEIIKSGKMPFLEKGGDKLLEKTTAEGLFSVTGQLSDVIGNAEIYIITIGTPLDNRFIPDQSGIAHLLQEIVSAGSGAAPSVLLRSTIAPGTSENIVREMNQRGICIGRDLYYAYCPERIAEGRAMEELGSIPQIIGTFDEKSAQKAQAFFSGLGIPCIVGSPTEAELAKLFNNMYRYVNFALANQCMYLAEKNDASIVNVLKMCNQGYLRGGPWLPGYAAGPCLYKDGFFLTNHLLFIDLFLASWKINESLPEVLLKEALSIRPLNNVALLGLAFKAGIDDTRNSLGIKLYHILISRGARVAVHDPYVNYPGKCITLEEALSGATEIFVMVPHDQYKDLSIMQIKDMAGPRPLIVDPWFLWNNRVITVHDS